MTVRDNNTVLHPKSQRWTLSGIGIKKTMPVSFISVHENSFIKRLGMAGSFQ
jgi:hypothetical protein